jgi:hypothetical protein
MKRALSILFLSGLSLMVGLQSCKPSESDVIQKIAKAWQVNKYYENNEDKTAEFKERNKNFTLQFYEDMSFVQSALVNDTLRTRSGSWMLNEDLDSLFLYSTQDTSRFFIRLLRIKNLNVREVKSDSTFDYLMVDY